jgi:pSer/pThr/pTyr-binding forkhead associated (FHA) protein
MPEIDLVPCWETSQECRDEDRTIAINHFPFVLGRATWCDTRIDHPLISREHCVISFRDGQIWIEDLASANGTRLNGEPVLAPCPVVDGALIQLAHLPFVVRQRDPQMASWPQLPALVRAKMEESDEMD